MKTNKTTQDNQTNQKATQIKGLKYIQTFGEYQDEYLEQLTMGSESATMILTDVA